jgi:hypothetical protein
MPNNISPLVPFLAENRLIPNLNHEATDKRTVDLSGNNISDLQSFVEQLPPLKPDTYQLFLGLNCLDMAETDNLHALETKGLTIDYAIDLPGSQKLECFMRVVFPWKSPPIFFSPQ